MRPEQLHVVYVSELTPGHGHSVFADVCRTARARNAERGIAGVLLFDGQRFMQWLYGTREAVLRLMASITVDPRHSAVELLFEAPLLLPTQDLELEWRAGFVEALDAFASVASNDDGLMLARLARLIAQADLEPPMDITLLSLAAAPGVAGAAAAGVSEPGRDAPG